MTDPAPLKLTARTQFAKTLLESAGGDHSAPGAAQRALLAVGVGASLASLTGGAASSASAANTATASSSIGVGSQWAGALSVKWLGLGLLVGSTSLLSLDYATRDTPAISPTNHALSAVSASAPKRAPADIVPQNTPSVNATSELLAPPLEALRRAASAPPLLNQPEHVEPTAVPNSDPLAELQAARSALAVHQPERALALLDAYEHGAASASLAEEASVLRIEALVDAGRPEAATLGADFLRQYPRSAYAARVRAKLHLP
jgi:hypothetical protein